MSAVDRREDSQSSELKRRKLEESCDSCTLNEQPQKESELHANPKSEIKPFVEDEQPELDVEIPDQHESSEQSETKQDLATQTNVNAVESKVEEATSVKADEEATSVEADEEATSVEADEQIANATLEPPLEGNQAPETKQPSIHVFGSAFKTVSFGSIDKPSIFDEPASSKSIFSPVDSASSQQQSFTETVYETGEENEQTCYEAKVKIYLFDSASKEWKERGIALVKINKSCEPESPVYRIIARHDVTKKLLINYRLSGTTLASKGKTPRTIQVSLPDEKGKLQIFLLKCSNDETFDGLWETIQDIISQ